jgi:cytosine deaminase
MPTKNSAKILRLKKYGVEVGNPADLNLINAKTVQEAFRFQSEIKCVIKGGRVVCSTEKKVNYFI